MSEDRRQAESELDPDAARLRQRLRALRGKYPGIVLATGLTHIHDDQVVIRAALTLPDGTSVSAFAAEPTDSSGLLDTAIELAAQRATIRALDLLKLDDVPEPATVGEQADQAAKVPLVEEESPPPVVDALRKASLRRQATVERPQPPAPDVEPPRPVLRPEAMPVVPEPEPAAELDLADYTWTHFWTWARANNLSTKGQVEQRIGRPIDNLTPRDVRQMLHETGMPL